MSWAAVVVALVGVAGSGCSSSATTLFLTVELPSVEQSPGAPANAAPASITVNVYDVHHALVHGNPIVSPRLPGTLIIDGLPASSQPLRVAVDSDAATGEEGAVAVTSASDSQVKGTVELSTTTPDTDKDDVPDSIDNCPTVANFDQLDQLGNGVGDACRGSTDGGGFGDLGFDMNAGAGDLASRDMGKLADLPRPVDMTPPVIQCNSLFCEDFETGSWNTGAWSLFPDSQATVTVDSTHSFSGRYALHMHGAANAKGYIQPSLETTQGMTMTGAFLRFWVFQTSTAPSDSLLFHARQLHYDPYGDAAVRVSSDILQLVTGTLTPGVPIASGNALPIGRWVCIEWQLQVDPNDGGANIPNGMQMWVTDPAESPSPGPAVVTQGPDAWYGLPSWGPILGYSPPGSSAAWDIWYDAIAIDSKRIGCD